LLICFVWGGVLAFAPAVLLRVQLSSVYAGA
jgi:hypothetical protein